MKINLDILTWHKVHRMTAGASYTGCSPWMHQKCAATPTYQLSHLTHLHSCMRHRSEGIAHCTADICSSPGIKKNSPTPTANQLALHIDDVRNLTPEQRSLYMQANKIQTTSDGL
nr:hypothetical protein Iba_chr06dCG9440 [Ipomoea batatas]